MRHLYVIRDNDNGSEVVALAQLATAPLIVPFESTIAMIRLALYSIGQPRKLSTASLVRLDEWNWKDSEWDTWVAFGIPAIYIEVRETKLSSPDFGPKIIAKSYYWSWLNDGMRTGRAVYPQVEGEPVFP